jgi:hypothetical protein
MDKVHEASGDKGNGILPITTYQGRMLPVKTDAECAMRSKKGQSSSDET